MNVDDPPRVIVVTSPKEGDGKSTVAVNIAAAMAASDRQVVLVDGDLRRPTVAESFGLAEGVGLTDLLIGRVNEGGCAADGVRHPAPEGARGGPHPAQPE